MELNHKQLGSGPPLIILHGLFGMLDNWITLGKKLAENYTVYLIDQRNHGKTGKSDVFNYQALSDDLHEFMNTHSINSSHLLGHSMGGKTIMQFAFDYPEKVKKLVVADISPAAYPNKHQMIFDAMLSVDFNTVKSRADVEAILSKTIKSKRLLQFLMKNLHRKDRTSLGWKTNLDIILDNLEEIGKAIEPDKPYTGQTLFIKGGRSDYITLKEMHIIKKFFPYSEIKTINGATHWLHADKPDVFYRLVIDFLRST